MLLVGAPERFCPVEETALVKTHQSPLSGPPPVEVPLNAPPIVRVIAQVRFPLIASIEKQEFIAQFQEAIRRDYPVLRQEQSRSLVLSSEGGWTNARQHHGASTRRLRTGGSPWHQTSSHLRPGATAAGKTSSTASKSSSWSW